MQLGKDLGIEKDFAFLVLIELLLRECKKQLIPTNYLRGQIKLQ